MPYQKCPFFSEDVIEVGEEHKNNYDKPFGNHCYSCKNVDCPHNSKRL
jgi:hypothetical protein